MVKIRCAVLGAGAMGTLHAQNAVRSGRAEIVGVCSRSRESVERLRSRLGEGVRGFTDYERMMDEVCPEVLFVCLPPNAHSGEVEDAAGRGIHLFLEKPLALDPDRASAMVRAAESAGVVTQVDFHHRFHPLTRRVRELIRTGAAGTASLMQAGFFCNSLHSPWWRDIRSSGGQLLEQVIHVVDLVLHLLGPANKVVGFQDNLCHRTSPGYSVEDTSTASMVMMSGAMASLSASNCAVPGRWLASYRLMCQNLTAEYSSVEGGRIDWTGQNAGDTEEFGPSEDLHMAVMLDFLKAARSGTPASVSIRSAYRAQELVHTLIQSITEGRIINIR
jgi:predicted dehydrogenase